MAISQHVADQLIAIGVSADRIAIVPNGIAVIRAPVMTPASHDLLVIARHDANKNLRGLVSALAGTQRLLPYWSGLVRIVGRGVSSSAELHALRRALPAQALVFIDRLSVDATATIRGSLALVSASLEEGFDYPVLEAKAEGIPTLLSDISVHREFHDASSLFFPIDDDGVVLADHISQLITDRSLWRQLSLSGLDLAHSFSVERQQNQILGLLNELR